MRADAFLFDLEGTIYVGEHAVAGAAAAIATLRSRGVPFRLVSNTTSRSRAMLVEHLRRVGIAATAEELWTAPLAAAQLARDQGARRVLGLLPRAAWRDLVGLEVLPTPGTDPVDALVIGDLGAAWSYELLQGAFAALQAGAGFIACSRDRYYRKGSGLALDAGPFVVALEYATGREALVAGKPSASFYRAAVASLGLAADAHVVMVGDDLWSDIQGAQGAGLAAWAVRTGKFRPEDLATSGIVPDRILTSIAEVAP